MALLTSQDIHEKQFERVKFKEGFDMDQVDDFLDQVIETVRTLEEEKAALEAQLAQCEARVAELSRADAAAAEGAPVVVVAPEAPAAQSEPESATGMLQLAQKLHDDYVRSGQEEGNRLVTQAQEQANRIVREAEDTSHRTLTQLEQEKSMLERKIDELRKWEKDYRSRLTSYLQNLLSDLEARGVVIPARNEPMGDGPQI